MKPQKSDHTAAKIGCISAIAVAIITTVGAILIAYINRSSLPTQNTQHSATVDNSNTLANGNDSAPSRAVATPTSPNVEPSNATNVELGVWDFHLIYDRGIGKDMLIKNVSGTYDMVVNLQKDGNLLRGALRGSIYDNNMQSCDEGIITGTIQGNSVSFILQFADKIRCCGGERWKFDGQLNADARSIEGGREKFIDRPPSLSCISLYSSSFVAHRR